MRRGDGSPTAILLRALPDVPRWVEARGMLMGGRGQIVAADDPPHGCLIWSSLDQIGVVVGRPPPGLLADTLARVPGGFEVVATGESRAAVGRALSDWAAEGATLYALPDAVRPGVTAPSGTDARLLQPGDAPQLAQLPPVLGEETRRAIQSGYAAGVFAGGRLVSFCCAGWVTERLWDVSIDTLEPHRRRGYARCAAAMMIRRMRELGKRPVWGALDSNPASLGLAAALGFVPADRIVVFTKG